MAKMAFLANITVSLYKNGSQRKLSKIDTSEIEIDLRTDLGGKTVPTFIKRKIMFLFEILSNKISVP
jgi:hypothetical protein